MTSLDPRKRKAATLLVAFAVLAMAPGLLVPAGLVPMVPAPSVTEAPVEEPGTGYDGRDLFLPITAGGLDISLSSRGGYGPVWPDLDYESPEPVSEWLPDEMSGATTLEGQEAEYEANKPSPTPTPTPVPTLTPTPTPTPTLAPTPTPMVFRADNTTIYVVNGFLNLRAEPNTDCAILRRLKYGDKLTRIGIGDGWYEVKASDGKTGYVSSQYVSTKAPPPRVATPTSVGLAVVAVAQKQLGKPYVHYAASPSTGFDCSGLTWYCYKTVGISVPRSARDYGSAGTKVSLASALPGDILCWDTRNDGKTFVTHVGIYIGNGMMIHASSSHDRVMLQDVGSYNAKLLSVKRFIR